MYLGIDPSLACTGLCLLDKKMKVVKYKALSFSASTEYRLRDYYDNLSDFIAVNGVNNIGMEAYAYAKSGQSMAFNIGELGGVFKLVFQQNEIPYIRPLPTEIKKFVTNKGRSEKEEVKKVLENDYGYKLKHKSKIKILDLYDALAISLITYYFFRRKKRRKLKIFQKEILKKIDARYRKESLKIFR